MKSQVKIIECRPQGFMIQVDDGAIFQQIAITASELNEIKRKITANFSRIEKQLEREKS